MDHYSIRSIFWVVFFSTSIFATWMTQAKILFPNLNYYLVSFFLGITIVLFYESLEGILIKSPFRT